MSITIGNCTIHTGDCMEETKKILDNSIDIICTSPPYNLGIKYSHYKDNLEYQEYLKWLETIFIEWKRVLKNNGSIFLNIGNTNNNPWLPMDVASRARNHLCLQNNIVWVKSITTDLDNEATSHGHFKPINSNRFINSVFENIFHFTKSGNIPINRMDIGVPYKWKCNRKPRLSKKEKQEKVLAIQEGRNYVSPVKKIKEDRRCAGNTWFIPYETIRDKSQRYHHPASFPVELARRCIIMHGLYDDMKILDPFMGIGSTLMACQDVYKKGFKIKGIGIEIDVKYSEAAKNRLQSKITQK